MAVRLDDEVHVVALHRDVADAEVAAPARDRQSMANREPARAPAELEARPRADHDVQRVARVDRWPRLVLLARARAPGGAARAWAPATVRADVEGLLRRHLEFAEIVQRNHLRVNTVAFEDSFKPALVPSGLD